MERATTTSENKYSSHIRKQTRKIPIKHTDALSVLLGLHLGLPLLQVRRHLAIVFGARRRFVARLGGFRRCLDGLARVQRLEIHIVARRL